MTGVGAGKVSSAARDDYAEAAAIVISQDGYGDKAYKLAGDDAWTQHEFAAELAAVIGSEVENHNVGTEEHADALEAAGVPTGARGFVVALDVATDGGALEERSGDLSRLLGRPTTPLSAVLRLAL